jgi:hypothetical protein
MKYLTFAALGVLLGLGSSSAVSANSSRVPVSFVDRSLTLPDAVMRLDGGPRWPDYDAQFKHVVQDGPDYDFLNPGISFGLTRNLEFGLVPPIRLSPDQRLEDPRFYMLYQLADAELSYGIFGQLRVGVEDHTTAMVGVPLYYRWTPNLRLETGGFAEVEFGEASSFNLIFPIYFAFQISDRLYAGPEAGLGLYGVFDDGGGIATPLGGFLGYTLGAPGAPLGDLYGRLRITDVPDGALELMFGFEFFFDL